MAEKQPTSQTDRDLQVGKKEDKRKDSVVRGFQLQPAKGGEEALWSSMVSLHSYIPVGIMKGVCMCVSACVCVFLCVQILMGMPSFCSLIKL